MNNNQLLYKLAISFIPGIGAVRAKDLISYCGGIDKVFSASKRTLLNVPGIGEVTAKSILDSDALVKAEKEIKSLENRDINICFYLDDDYPTRLKNYDDSPLLLYSKGRINLNVQRTVAIVGTRKITSYGIVECEKLIEGLADYNCTILSGLAYGVDTTAHRKSVELDIPTVGILGNGLNKIYPSANHSLAQKMLANGGVMSEYPMDVGPNRENFPKRNRVIVGLADVVVVVESAKSGGSMISAEYANNYNKDVFAIPGKTTDPYSEGCNHLIKTHKAHLLTSAADIAYIMRWDKPDTGNQMAMFIELEPNEEQLVTIIRANPNIGLDSLHYQTKLPLGQLTSTLLNLEFKGLLRSLPGKKYILSR